MNKPKLGDIKFINCLPLHHGLMEGGFGEKVSIKSGTPAELNSLVVAGELDVSPVSSIIYARHSDKLLILPDVSISANGALQSILLVSKYPIEQLKEARIALTAKSATSHGLLKIIMYHAYQANPDYFISPLSLEGGVLKDAEAVLFIGDDALQAYHNRVPGYYYYDLGDEWQRMTGLSMVYAVWVVNRQFAARHADLVHMVYQQVTGAFAYGLSNLSVAAETLAPKVSFTTQQLITYINLLNYEFTPAHKQALVTYYQLSHVLGLIDGVPAIEFAEVMK
ncbi:menaquinone biosynthetic enzyme MqnA/MqnD family protein [Pelosinus sp. sgz500959]|uniref:menaquinone biosynthetic enzyme MqnA/MqnD family protein n=1 Tax=Pelosinus sp. sgz500959 TaxID=3242472 RepID=UPI003672D404